MRLLYWFALVIGLYWGLDPSLGKLFYLCIYFSSDVRCYGGQMDASCLGCVLGLYFCCNNLRKGMLCQMKKSKMVCLKRP